MAVARYLGRRRIGSPVAAVSLSDLAPARPVDEEPARLRRPAVRATAVRPRPRSSPRSAAFAIFCALSGVVYLINDVVGPRERSAPSAQEPAADRVGRAAGAGRGCRRPVVIGAVALAGARRCSAGVRLRRRGRVPRRCRSLYSGPLKHIVIIDVLTIAIGFVLRAVAGAVAVDVEISHWLLVCTILLALFIALAKRRHELVLLADGAAEPSADSRRVQRRICSIR